MKNLRKISIIVGLFSVFFISVLSAHATLELRGTDSLGNRLIYDSDLNITWYDHTNVGPGYGDTLQNQMDWASALSVNFGGNIYDGWRLPTSLNQDGSGPCKGNYCTGSELGHLYYTELGNKPFPEAGWGLKNTGDFQNLRPSQYWTNTEYSANPALAWIFNINAGDQSYRNKGDLNFAIAVRDGDVPAIISTATMFTLRDWGPNGSVDEMSVYPHGGFYGVITNIPTRKDESFVEFNMQGSSPVSVIYMSVPLRAMSVWPTPSETVDLKIAYYSGSGSPAVSLFGGGTFFTSVSQVSKYGSNYYIDVTEIYNNAVASGYDFLGFRFYDPIWTSTSSGAQAFIDALPVLSNAFDNDADGYTLNVDCNDNDTAVNPGATEVCDGQDNDCDSSVDEGCNNVDLYVTSVSAQGSASPGDTITVGATVNKSGSGSAAASTARIYIYGNLKGTGNKFMKLGDVAVPVFGAGSKSYTFSSSVKIPPWLNLGSHSIVVIADVNNIVPEWNENNNRRSKPITIVP